MKYTKQNIIVCTLEKAAGWSVKKPYHKQVTLFNQEALVLEGSVFAIVKTGNRKYNITHI